MSARIAFVFAAILAPLIAPYNPLALSSNMYAPPSFAHWFGTDELGRDIRSRAVYGGRVSLLTAAMAIVGATLIGVALGLIGGYFREMGRRAAHAFP